MSTPAGLPPRSQPGSAGGSSEALDSQSAASGGRPRGPRGDATSGSTQQRWPGAPVSPREPHSPLEKLVHFCFQTSLCFFLLVMLQSSAGLQRPCCPMSSTAPWRSMWPSDISMQISALWPKAWVTDRALTHPRVSLLDAQHDYCMRHEEIFRRGYCLHGCYLARTRCLGKLAMQGLPLPCSA